MFFGELLRGAMRKATPLRRWGVTVTDAQGLILHELSMNPVAQAAAA